MEKNFSVDDYLQHLAHELIRNFDYAGRATTPGLVGGARETEVRNKLSLLFPNAIGVGTGCIIDSYSRTSKQTDVVLYENNFCPVFAVNNTPEATYYPCEGVVAVGEIKSVLDRRDLIDSFAKIKSVKLLERYSEDNTLFRKYGSNLTAITTVEDQINPRKNARDQIYGFILCERIGLKVDAFLAQLAELSLQEPGYLLPNLIISLTEGIFTFSKAPVPIISMEGMVVLPSANNANSIFHMNLGGQEFQYLLRNLHNSFSSGRSTGTVPFMRYMNISANTQAPVDNKPACLYPLHRSLT